MKYDRSLFAGNEENWGTKYIFLMSMFGTSRVGGI